MLLHMADTMDRTGVAMLLFFVFYVKKSAECNNDSIFAMAGCDVSFNWTLGNTPIKIIHAIVFHSSNKTAQLIGGECGSMDKSSAYCNTSKYDDEWILSLTIFNVTEEKSGDYSIQFLGPDQAKKVSFKHLVVIGKPTIMALRKPILHQPFEMTCKTPFGLQCFIYRWKLNGSEITPVGNLGARYVSSLRMTDNLRQVACQVCLNETACNFSSEICKHDGCSADSDPYEIEVIYGPDTISLSLNESHFYLKEHEPFTIDCFANCNPTCTFRWKGHDTIDGEKLAISSFEPRMSGQYTCYVTNQQTNSTSKSNPIILHHEKEDKLKAEDMGDLRLMQSWMGPVIVSVLLLIVGCSILVTDWRKNRTRVIDSRELCYTCVGQTDNEVSQTELGSKVREDVPLRTLLQAPHTTKWHTKNSTISDDSANNKSRSEQDLRKDNSAAKIKEDPYNTIDEDAMSVYDHRIDNILENNSHETRGSTEHVFYDYSRSIEIFHVETGNVREADETYITPISDLSCPLEIFQDEETDMLGTNENKYITPISDLAPPTELCENGETNVLGTDQTYITPINDFGNPIEICQVEETDMNVTDATYITPIN